MADFDPDQLVLLSQFAIHGFATGFVIYFIAWCTSKLFYFGRRLLLSR